MSLADKVYDITDLKEKISKLKELQKSRIAEKQTLIDELTEKEKLLTRMKQEYTIMAPNAELRYYPTATSAANSVVLSTTGDHPPNRNGPSGSVHLEDAILDKDLVDDKRFRIWNEKLEMQILINEIRPVIANLEKEVKYYEKETEFHKKAMIRKDMKNAPAPLPTYGKKKGLAGEEKDSSPSASVQFEEKKENTDGPLDLSNQRLLLKPTKEIQQIIEQVLNEIIECKIQKKSMIEKQKQSNQYLMNNLISIRKEIQQKITEKLALKKFILNFESQLMLQKKRKELVVEEFLKLRKESEEKYKAYLWQTAVFRQETGSENGRMSVDRIVPVLSKWIVVRKTQIPWTTPEFLLDLLEDIRKSNAKYSRRPQSSSQQRLSNAGREESKGRHDDDGEEDELVVIPETSNKNSPKDTRDDEEIDLVTFCLLCNQLILLLE